MAFDGSGTFDRIHSWVADRDAGTKITALRHDAEDDGFATGLSNCVTKDGQTLPTANLPMNTKKLTGLAAGTADGDSVRYEQVARLDAANVLTATRNRFSDASSGSSSVAQTHPGVLISAQTMNTTDKYTPGLMFGSTDAEFTTTSPKMLAGIFGIATETYAADTDSGMGLEFFTTPDNAGATPTPTLRMTIDQDGNVGIGNSTPDALLHVQADAGTTVPTISSGTAAIFARTAAADNVATISVISGNTSTSNLNLGDTDDEDIGFIQYDHTSNFMRFVTGASERLRTDNNGTYFPAMSTTASAANAFLDSGSSPANRLLRSTSSLAYKRDVEPVEKARVDAVMQGISGIWYRSTSEADNPDWSWYGFAAEEVAAVDPRLVHWGYHDSDYEMVETTDEHGTLVEPRLKPGTELKPDGVMYDRIVVLHQEIIREQQAIITDLVARVAALEAA